MCYIYNNYVMSISSCSLQLNIHLVTKTLTLNRHGNKKMLKRVARGSYSVLTSSIVRSPRTSDKVICEVAHVINNEMKTTSSLEHNSILRCSNNTLKEFSWEMIWVELVKSAPTLMKFLSCLVCRVEDNKTLICLIAFIET